MTDLLKGSEKAYGFFDLMGVKKDDIELNCIKALNIFSIAYLIKSKPPKTVLQIVVSHLLLPNLYKSWSVNIKEDLLN